MSHPPRLGLLVAAGSLEPASAAGAGGSHPVLRLVEAAEDAGFDAVVLDARPTGTDPVRDPFVLLGAAAEATTRLGLGALTQARRRPPGIIGKAVASLDVCSGGRALHVLAPFPGCDADELREELEVVTALLRRPAPSYDGAFHHLDSAWNEPRAVRRAPTPVGLLVPAGERAGDDVSTTVLVGVAAVAADWCVLELDGTWPDLAEHLGIVAAALEAAATDAGRPPGAVRILAVLSGPVERRAISAALGAVDGVLVAASSDEAVRRLARLSARG